MSFVTRLKLAPRLLVEELQGKAAQLVLDVRPQLEHCALHHIVEQVTLHPAED
jgi:hypothetical protein